jgi:hypothetical protein
VLRARIRLVALLCSLLQASLPLAAGIADARLDAASGQPVHLESQSSGACRVVHPENCALCQFLSTFKPLATHHSVPLVDVAVRRLTFADRRASRSTEQPLSRLARAPPPLA